MEITHRITVSSTAEVRRELAALGIDVAAFGYVTFEISEAHDRWPAIQRWLSRRRAVDAVTTTFSQDEIARAKWLHLASDWLPGYPQPSPETFGYRDATYDLTDWCERCGIGLRQNRAFQLTGEPSWGPHGVLQLHWVAGELFVRPDVWTRVFAPSGIACRPVTDPHGDELRSVVQLVVDEAVDIDTGGLAPDQCASCDRVKYQPVTRGAFPALRGPRTSAMVRTSAYFSDGPRADRLLLVSQDVARRLATHQVQAVSFVPVGT